MGLKDVLNNPKGPLVSPANLQHFEIRAPGRTANAKHLDLVAVDRAQTVDVVVDLLDPVVLAPGKRGRVHAGA